MPIDFLQLILIVLIKRYYNIYCMYCIIPYNVRKFEDLYEWDT